MSFIKDNGFFVTKERYKIVIYHDYEEIVTMENNNKKTETINSVWIHIKNTDFNLHDLTEHSGTIVLNIGYHNTLFFDNKAKLRELREKINEYLEGDN